MSFNDSNNSIITSSNLKHFDIYQTVDNKQITKTCVTSYKIGLLEECQFYRDLTHLKTYTIDDIDTIEVDDAISIERNEDSLKVWVHISSPSLFIELNDPLDQIARRNAATIYLGEETVTMFPSNIIDELLTIKANKSNFCLSCCVELNIDGSIASSEVYISKICNNYKLTYEDADELIELAPKEEEDLSLLHILLDKRRRWRLNNGSLSIEGIEGRVKLLNNKLSISFYEKTPSRVLIEEAMLLMGHVISLYSIDHNINIPFRCQDSSTIPTLDYNLHYSLRNNLLRKSLCRSYISQIPSIHFSLGLSCYVQCTSPIRRYIDLLTHYQITNKILKKDLISRELMDQLICSFKSNQIQVNEKMKDNKTKWLANYLLINKAEIIQCYFLRWLSYKRSSALVFVINYSFEFVFCIHTNSNINFGDKITLKILNSGEDEEHSKIFVQALMLGT
ncbi:ribonuclease catalytic domain-containing protein [Prochlorococcus sp. MIT 1223]|uniref:ribonuclease catalytic domain-containing protein n=1 Tax=Prochlorococcus sp. MIT 1223 TaxID=3096217 RepID=UPI002A764F4D|nr:ribonuclease catalytic domain-containing protein [Prochlorococcus sp. MIT 1223]